MVADAEGAPDYSRHALGGPHIADEVVRLRPLRHERGELRALLGGELGDATGWRMPMQYLHPACARPLLPSGGASGLSHARPFHKSSQRSVDRRTAAENETEQVDGDQEYISSIR